MRKTIQLWEITKDKNILFSFYYDNYYVKYLLSVAVDNDYPKEGKEFENKKT